MSAAKHRRRDIERCLDAHLPLLPCKPGTKHALWTGWRVKPSFSRDEALGWLAKDGSFIVRTGHHPLHKTSVVVVDADLYKGEDGVVEAAVEALELPDTWTAESARGGLHYYFNPPAGLAVPSDNSGKLGQFIDTRADGGCCVSPGSVWEGKPYKWLKGPDELACAALPQNVIDLLGAAKRPKTKALTRDAVDEFDVSRVRNGDDPFRLCPGAPEGRRNGTAFAYAMAALLKTGGNEDIVEAALHRWGERCKPAMDKAEVGDVLVSAFRRHRLDRPDHYEDERPTLYVADKLERSVDTIESVLKDSYPPGHPRCIYSRGGTLVVARRHDESGIHTVKAIPAPTLRERIGSVVRFRNEGNEKPISVPVEVVQSLMGRGSYSFPVLAGIRHSPFMRSDGSIVSEQGYDEETKHLAMFQVEKVPSSLKRSLVTEREAQRAYTRLCKPLCDFPFKSGADRAAAILSIATLVSRPAVRGPVPLFAVRAHTAGTGKGLLVQAVCSLAMGHRPSFGMPLSDTEEMRKRLFSLALAGEPVMVLDNEEGRFGNKVLSAALTSTSLTERVLGQSVVASVPWRAVVFVTGNNLVFRKDQARRTVTIDLDARVERPEERSGWKYPDVVSFCEDKSQYAIFDVLRILRAHRCAGLPAVAPFALGGFEEWDQKVRQAIAWVAQVDPLASRLAAVSSGDDLDLAALSQFLHAWREHVHGAKTAAQVLEIEAMRPHFGLIARSKKELSAWALGVALGQIRGRIADSMRLQSSRNRAKTQEWSLEISELPTTAQAAQDEP